MTVIQCTMCERTKEIGADITSQTELDLFVVERHISCNSAICGGTKFVVA